MWTLVRLLLEAWGLSLDETRFLLGLQVGWWPALSRSGAQYVQVRIIIRSSEPSAGRTCLGWQHRLLWGLGCRSRLQRVAHNLLLLGNKGLWFSLRRICR